MVCFLEVLLAHLFPWMKLLPLWEVTVGMFLFFNFSISHSLCLIENWKFEIAVCSGLIDVLWCYSSSGQPSGGLCWPGL